MRWVTIGAVAIGATVASAFRDTSPLFYFSTANDAVKSEPVRQLTTASAITQNLKSRLATCSSDAYLIISQPGIDAADFTSPHISPRLRRSVNLEGGVKSGFAVASVVGDLDLEELQNYLEKTCEASSLDVDASTGAFDVVDDMKPRVIRVDFSRPSASQPERADQLSQNDAFLSSIIDLLPSPRYAVIYTTTPSSSIPSASEQSDGIHQTDNFHQELKRDSKLHRRDDNITYVDGPLFERYQFFTPGLFMGLLVGFLLLAILYIAINGVASLQVPYAAFDKEMGPGAQKKQQ